MPSTHYPSSNHHASYMAPTHHTPPATTHHPGISRAEYFKNFGFRFQEFLEFQEFPIPISRILRISRIPGSDFVKFLKFQELRVPISRIPGNFKNFGSRFQGFLEISRNSGQDFRNSSNFKNSRCRFQEFLEFQAFRIPISRIPRISRISGPHSKFLKLL